MAGTDLTFGRSVKCQPKQGRTLARRQFDFCLAIRNLCDDICRRHQAFRHIDLNRVVITYAQTRSAVEWGMQAKLTPMRFENGALSENRDGQRWTVQRICHQGQEALYVLTFYLPRFLNQTPDEKLVTVFHELYHISPQFDGDIRRFAGACYMHGHSQAAYDRRMAVFAKEYIKRRGPMKLRKFLLYDFETLRRTYGDVVGLRIPIPRVIPVEDWAA